LTPDWKTASLNNGTCVEARLDHCGNGTCVEVRAACGNGACVEVRSGVDIVQVRDSKDPGGPVLSFASAGWAEFLGGIRDGEFDL
jgi:hypothetical protein